MAMTGVQLSSKQVDELREAFIIYDSDADKKVNQEQAKCIIRSIGIAPSNEQFNRMFGNNDLFTLEDLHSIVTTKCPAFESEESLRDAIRLFDRYGNSYVDAKEIRHILTNLGERLKDDEVDEITREMDISGDNQISCDEFVRTIRSVF